MKLRYNLPNQELFIKNRKKFTAEMEGCSIAVFNSNDIYPISADSTMPFKQHSDIFYLSGIDQEETILLLFPNSNDPLKREILFVKETNAHIAVWEGEKFTKEEATKVSGIKTVFWTHQFEAVFFDLMTEAETIYFNTNEHYRQAVISETREDRFIKWCKDNFPAHRVAKSNPILQRIRSIKEEVEVDFIRQACNITEKGFRRVLRHLKPGVMEYEIEAEYIHEFVANRSRGFAYSPIIASGKNACVLHYTENSRECKSGDLILMDVGAEYANYCSDMTRTVPVNGKFTARQREIYVAVLRVMKEATKMLVPGVIWKEYHVEVGKIMTSELIGLGLLTKEEVANENPNRPAYKKYFMHGTSHNMGLDTHDYGNLKEPIKANMVFTVEPGIYVPKEGIGVRLENDVRVKEKGAPEDLMASIPIEPDEIEDLMNA